MDIKKRLLPELNLPGTGKGSPGKLSQHRAGQELKQFGQGQKAYRWDSWGCPLQGQERDSTIHVGPFQPKRF